MLNIYKIKLFGKKNKNSVENYHSSRWTLIKKLCTPIYVGDPKPISFYTNKKKEI
jgi:hypothetical protein